MSFLESLFGCFNTVVQTFIASDFFIPLVAAALFCGVSVLICLIFKR